MAAFDLSAAEAAALRLEDSPPPVGEERPAFDLSAAEAAALALPAKARAQPEPAVELPTQPEVPAKKVPFDLSAAEKAAADIPLRPTRRAPSRGFGVPSGDLSSTFGFGVQGPAIPGLSISGGQFTSLPESLPTEAPPALLANPGKLSRDQLNRELRLASVRYSKTRDMGKRVQILAEFIRAWDPKKADSLGITGDGHVEPTGFWKILDWLDSITARPFRVGVETLYEGSLDKAVSALRGEKSDEDFFSSFGRNWEEDKGRLSKGGDVTKNLYLWLHTAGTFGDFTKQQAEEVFARDARYDVAEQDLADWISASSHETAGFFKGRSSAETQRITEEAKAQGSPGAQMAIDLFGFVAFDALNLIGLGPFRGAMGGVDAAQSTRRLMGLGIKTNPLADLRMGNLEISSMSQARKGFVEDLVKTSEAQTVGARVRPGRRAAAQASIDATADQVASLTKISDELTGVERGLIASRSLHVDLLGKTDKVSVAAMEALVGNSARLGAKYDTLMTQFDETFNALAKTKGAGRISGKALFGGIQARAATIVGREVMDATDLAMKYGIKSGAVGSRSIPLLSEAREFARAEGLRVFDAEDAWVEAMRAGEKSKKVLVDLGLGPVTRLGEKGERIGGIASNPTFLSPGEARVYEAARNGVHGSKAKVAAYYPSMGVLQKTMGGKKFAHLAAEATDEIIAISAGKGYRSAGRRAIVKGIQKAKGMSKAEIAFQADRIVTNVRPMGFALAHAIAKKFPWAERIRRPLAGIASLTHRPMTYATKGPDGKWAAIEPNLLMHPVLHRRMAAEERQRLTSIAKLRSAWPVWKAQLENMAGGSEELLDVGRFAYEIGWASEETALATLKDVNKLAAVETVNNFINKVSLTGKALKAGEGRTVQVLGADEVQQIGASLKFLRENTGLEGRFFDDMEKLASDYVSASRGVEADVAILGIESVTAKARAAFLEDLRLQSNVLYSAAHASLERRLRFQTERAVAGLGSEFDVGLEELSKKLAGIDAQLAARKSAAVQTDASKQLDEAIAALGGVTKEDILRSRDVHADAYRGSLEDFRRSVAAEFGDDVADEAMRGAEAVEDFALQLPDELREADVERLVAHELSELSRGLDEATRREVLETGSDGRYPYLDAREESFDRGLEAEGITGEVSEIDGIFGVRLDPDDLDSWSSSKEGVVSYVQKMLRAFAREEGWPPVPRAALPRAPGLAPPAAAAEAAGRRGAMSVEDVAQSYSQSVRAAWNNGDDVSIRSLFEASWDPVNNKIDATLLGDTTKVSGLKLPKGVQGAIEEIGKARRAIDEATVSLRVAEDIEAGVIGEKTAAAQKALVGARSEFNSLLEGGKPAWRSGGDARRATDLVSRDPLFVRGQGNLLHEVGSDQRRILEAIQLHYRGRIASITSQVATEASVIRERSRKAMTSLADKLRSVRPRVLTQSKEDKLRDALKQLGDSIFGRDISVKLPAGKDVSADILLKRAVVKARKIKDPAKRAATLQKEIVDIKAKLAKVGDAISETQLGKAVAALDARRVSKKKMLPTEVSAFNQAISDHVDKFLKAIDDSTFDLRHPDDILRPIEDRITAHYNNAEAAKAVFNAKIKILKDADLAKLIPSLSADQAARVSKLVKNPLLHNLIDGPERLLGKFQSQLTSARKKLVRYEGEGVDAAVIEKQRKNIASLEEKIRIMGDPEDFEKVKGVARIMKDFFDEHLRGLKEAGVLDDAFDADEFFARVDVGAYFPHILSQAAKKKLDAFGVGTGGRVGRSIVNYFSQNRKMAGVVEDIHEFRKGADAEKILVHAAKNGQYGEGAAQAAANGKESLKSFFRERSQSFDDFVEEIKEGALMAEYNGLFETDPLVVMEYYHMKASEAVADARFIDTTLDLFPAGRLIAEITNVDDRAAAAQQMGYVPLGEVEHLESILKKRLPKGLKGLSKELKVRVINGASMDEIEALVRAEIGQDVPRDVLTALSDPKMKIPYVPIQIKEYLNWRNSTDAFLAKKSMGTDVWDGMQAWAKAQATIVALAHIGRNFIGNTISLLQEIGFAALNPSTQITAMRIWGSWGDDSLDALVKIGSHEMTVRDWREFFSSRGFFDEALSTDFLEESVGFVAKQVPSNQQLAAQLTGTGLGAAGGGALASLIPGMMPLGVFAGGALGLKAAKKWSGVKAVRGGSAYQRFIKDTGKEIKETPRTGIAKAGSRLTALGGGAIVGSAAPAMALPMAALSVSSVEDYLQMMSGLNRAAESQARLSMAVGLMKRGVAPDEALIRVNRSLRDYSDLTPIEKNVFRRFFFFYTWEAGNIKYQLNWMKRNPATARGLAAFTNGVYQMQFTEEQLAEIPEHWRYGVVVKSGAAKLIAISGLPWQPMIEVLTRSKEGMPMQGMMTRINPAILTTMEMMVGGGTSFYYGRPIKELNNINQLKKGPPMLKMIFGYPEEPNYYAPIYKNGVKTGRTRAVRKSTAPITYYLAQKLPGWRWMNQYMILSAETFNSYALESALTPEEVEDARAEWYERVAMFGFGFKETMLDWDYEGYRIRKELNERMLDMINNQYPMAVGERRYLRKQLSAQPNQPPQMELEE